jgi:hypothetical protein
MQIPQQVTLTLVRQNKSTGIGPSNGTTQRKEPDKLTNWNQRQREGRESEME